MFDGIVFPAPSKSSYNVGECYDNGQFVHIPRLPAACADEDADGCGFVRSLSTSAADADACFDPRRATDVGEDPTWGVGLLMWPKTRKGQNAPADTKQRLLIYGHPNAVDIGQMAYELTYYAAALDCLVLAYEFRGYGLCEGKASEEACLVDLKSAIRWGVDVLGFPVESMILMGRSIGTGPATQLAAAFGRANHQQSRRASADEKERDDASGPAMLVLEAPFKSIRECTSSIARNLGLASMGSFAAGMVGDRFRSIDAIGDVECPIVIVHGDQDSIVPFDHGVALAEAANKAYYTRHGAAAEKADMDRKRPHALLAALEGIGHNDIPPQATIRAIYGAQPGIIGPIRMPQIGPHFQPHPEGMPEVPRVPLAGRLPSHSMLGQFRLEAMTKSPTVVWPRPDAGVHGAENVAAYASVAVASLASAIRVAWIEYNRCLELHESSFAAPSTAASATSAFLSVVGLASAASADGASARALENGGSAGRPAALPMTLAEFVDACIAAWGSPFAVYRVSPAASSSNDNDEEGASSSATTTLVWFGRTIRVAKGGAGVEPGDHGQNYFDFVWRTVDHAVRAARRAAADPNSSSTTRPDPRRLPALEPLLFAEASSKLRDILRRNVDHTSTVAITHPARLAEDDVVAAAASLPPTPSSTHAAAAASGLGSTDDVGGKVTALTSKGHAAVQLECERFVLLGVDNGVLDRAGVLLYNPEPQQQHEGFTKWREAFTTLSRSVATLSPCVTRVMDRAAICDWHQAADAIRIIATGVESIPGDAAPEVVHRPDPHSAAAPHPRDTRKPTDASAAHPEEETDVQRAHRLINERRQRKARVSDSDCTVA